MAAPTSDKNRLRRLFQGLGLVVSPDFDTEVDQIYEDLTASYPTAANDEMYARAKYDIGESLYVGSTKIVSYQQDQESADLSDVSKALEKALKLWRADIDKITDKVDASSKNGVAFGDYGTHPPTWRDRPHDH
jgi:hypothetical protein